MKTQFKFLVLMLITSVHIQAQIQEIYKNSFDASTLKTLSLDLEGTYVLVEASEDNKVHFNYTIEFDNYSKKEIQSHLDKIKTSVQLNADVLEFKTSGSNTSSDIAFSVESLFGITFEGDYISFKEPTNRKFRKGRQHFIEINSSSRVKSLKEYLKNIRELDEKGKKRKINTKNVKILKTKFTIKMPAHLNLRLMAENSSLNFGLDIESQLIVNARNTSFKFQNISNPLNSIDVVNGNFRCNTLTGGFYKFNHTTDVQIASVSNLKLDNEFTKTTIGEIGENVEIIDFNGKFWLHNFSNNFGTFKMNTEYSEINLFYPEDMDFYIETFGHDTVHNTIDFTTEIPPSKKNKSSKMMVIGEDTSQNKIKINTVHGIIRFGKDFIDLAE